MKRRLKWNRTGGNEKSVFRGEDDTPKWRKKLDWNGALGESLILSRHHLAPSAAKWRPLRGFSVGAISHNAES
jgi:hypothetical protein